MTTTTLIDVRTIEPRQRHAQIFGLFDGLEAGQSFTLVNDHDPVPLRFQLESRSPGQVQWAYEKAGPDLWQVVITKQSQDMGAAAAAGHCCGSCG